jgi:cytochrome c oxidase subunit 1
VLSWLLTRDHKRIAILYAISVTIFFFVGGGLRRSLMRLELLTPEGDLFTSDTYNKLFTLHGIVMIFFLPDPRDPGGDRELHPADHARRERPRFPKLNLLSWYIYMIGARSASS